MTAEKKQRLSLLRVLGPMHIWALGVGIVLVGEFMGWNFTVAKGGVFGALVACWFAGILYSCVAMIDSEVSSTVASAGGQYAQAKHIIGPLAAFNLGLFLIFEYSMLASADAIVVGAVLQEVHSAFNTTAFVVLTIAFLTWLNYRGVHTTLTFNFVITAIAFVTIILLLFGGEFWSPGKIIDTKTFYADPGGGALDPKAPYGWLGFLAALQFGIWYYLGIEGTCQAAEECRSAPRALPIGTMSGLITLLIAATITWYVGTGLVDWITLGSSAYPLYDAALNTGKQWLIVALFIGTVLSCLASANGCINDASRAWFAMGRDQFIPRFFGGVHPKYKTPYRAILFLVPIIIAFGYTGLLDQVITFSIISGLLMYAIMPINIIRFRRLYPMDSIRRGYVYPFHPYPAYVLMLFAAGTFIAIYFGYWKNLVAAMLFYLIASLWFVFHRYRMVDRSKLYTMPWPRPKGY
ncbi:MAG: amino acid permease [Thermoleophilia bacterium]|nr:amino acid permease [Thermoleophilia bacterium]